MSDYEFEILGVVIRIQESLGTLHYSVRLGNTARGFYSLSRARARETIEQLEQLKNVLESFLRGVEK